LGHHFQISRANPFWGTPILQKVLALLGYTVSTATIWKYIDCSGKEPSMTWRAFLKNHASQIDAIDFFTVPTVIFRILYGFVVLEHSTRRIIYFIVSWPATGIPTCVR